MSLRWTLRAGSVVFAASAVLLLVAPGLFLELLGLAPSDSALEWSMRMIGMVLVALAALMWMVSHAGDDVWTMRAGVVMAIIAAGLGVLTLMIPAPLGWFNLAFAAVGFLFAANYVVCMARRSI
jgi:hypothetical protein